ncbi:MAG: uL15m family ribosomal protein [Nanoarchaeota archaeon]
MKIKKSRKSKRQRGQTTYGHGARKKWKGSGHKGGKGMAGSGKRADQKKTLVNKLYGNKYFGKQGITSRGTRRNKDKKINVGDIQRNLPMLMKKFGRGEVLELKKYKVLGEGELTTKLHLKVAAISEGALEKVKRAGGSVEILKKREKEEEKNQKNNCFTHT